MSRELSRSRRTARWTASKPMEERTMSSALITDLLGTLDELSGGVHPGFRPAHAKGLMCIGTFSPSPQAAELTRASHVADEPARDDRLATAATALVGRAGA